MHRSMKTLACFCVLSIVTTVSEAQSAEPLVFGSVHLRIVEKGGWVQKLLTELGSAEAQAVLIATCAYFGQDCTKPAALMGEVKHYYKQEGEEHRGSYISPAGYVLCQTTLKVHSHDNRTTFNASYRDDGGSDRLDYYAVVPKFRKKRAVDMTISFAYARPTDRAAYKCFEPNTVLWACPHNWYCGSNPPGAKIIQPH